MTASPESLQQRYEAIEGFYNGRQWDDVASLSEALLVELPDDPSHPLRQRLQLLLGHTYCYGYQDAQTATGFYSRVLAASEETMLREIAEQGLKQCINLADIAVAPAEATPDQSPAATAASSATAVTAGTAATPWMEQLGEVGRGKVGRGKVPQPEVGLTEVGLTEVEVIEEPELIELAQANPRTAEAVDLAILPVAAQPSPEEIAELSKGLLRVVIG
ncbi:hypothetical protein [Synechococcus sp. CBW1108]|uniref:hypothetical protein n=1 Tax=Synechococcus sp. CBW1108 TaxID=1353147 RepID=UPI0018CF7285|nr:hypothetical protein [Synechococcus sp. CBW1108]QPN71421.1 hypothetical protein H8F27_07640 [Synechococcus sp. CBW1108]